LAFAHAKAYNSTSNTTPNVTIGDSRTFVIDIPVVDAYGHVASINKTTFTLPNDADTTYYLGHSNLTTTLKDVDGNG
jgi:hypothetical protein